MKGGGRTLYAYTRAVLFATFYYKKKGGENRPLSYPDRESNSELIFRRDLLYPFNYQGP